MGWVNIRIRFVFFKLASTRGFALVLTTAIGYP